MGQHFEWWYRLTSLPTPPPNASLDEIELARRSHQASTILIILTLAALAPVSVAFQQKNIPFFVILGLTLLTYFVCLTAFNRRGNLVVAGVPPLLILYTGFLLNFLNIPGGLHPGDLATFDLLVETTLIAAAFFEAWGILLLAMLNSAFILATLLLSGHIAPDLQQMFQFDSFDVLVRPLILQWVVAVILFIFTVSTRRAMQRADRAEVIADLER